MSSEVDVLAAGVCRRAAHAYLRSPVFARAERAVNRQGAAGRRPLSASGL